MPVFKLVANSFLFPPTVLADHDGLLAYGGDLCIERMINAYSNGIFPWYNPGEEILWWSPHKRFIIFPKEIHISRSMKKFMKTTHLQIKVNTDFSQIMHSCRKLREGETWISDEMEDAYNALFEKGHVMCVGVYDGENLVGGLYGVVIGKCFFGESMFSTVQNASKMALIHLCQTLAEEEFLFIDCQFHTPHLEKMGGRFIQWSDFRRMLREGIGKEVMY
ncbi:MAG: leucyl/phenylalanyl-tRNA--protein transferase [Defluviitaleaceae bacterium]|nr:leucyl/phenylalanyl-tRNA--protein transferase [Defluviitaleaceae bacterium]